MAELIFASPADDLAVLHRFACALSSPMSRPSLSFRRDGWTPQRQLTFLEALAQAGNVGAAAAAAGMSREGAYRLRRRVPAATFAAA